MLTTSLHSLALVHLSGFHIGHAGGFFPLLGIAVAVGIAAWALAGRDPLEN